MTTANEDSGAGWKKDLSKGAVKLIKDSLREFKEDRESQLNDLIGELATKVKMNDTFFEREKSDRIPVLHGMLSSIGNDSESYISEIDALVLQPSQASVNILTEITQRLVDQTSKVAPSENSSTHTVDSSTLQCDSLNKSCVQNNHDEVAEDQDSTPHAVAGSIDTKSPTDNENRKRPGNSEPSGSEQRGNKKPRTTAPRGRGRKPAPVATKPARKKAEQPRSNGDRWLYHENLPTKEFVFKCHDKFWVLRCNEEKCARLMFEENPFAESRALHHFEGHDHDQPLSEAYIFETYAYNVKNVEEKWVKQRAKGCDYHCIPKTSVWAKDDASHHQPGAAQQIDSVEEPSPFSVNTGSTTTEESDCESVDQVRCSGRNLRPVPRPDYRQMNNGKDPLEEYEDSSSHSLSPHQTTGANCSENLGGLDATIDHTNLVATAQSWLLHSMDSNTPFTEHENGIACEPPALHSYQPTTSLTGEYADNTSSPSEFSTLQFRPVNEVNMKPNPPRMHSQQ